MEFIDELVIPATANHVLLIKYMLMISLLLFIPYLGMVLGATFLSTRYAKKGKIEGNNNYKRFAKDVIEKLTITQGAELALGVVPVLSALFAYAQLLYMSKTITVSIMALAAVLFIVAFVFVYKYRNTFKIESVLHYYKKLVSKEVVLNPEDDAVQEIEDFEEKNLNMNSRAGTVAKWLLLAGAYLFAGTMALASTPNRWEHVGNILQVIFSWQSMFSFFALLALSGIITGGAIMFYFFQWNGGLKDMTDEYAETVKKIAGSLALISSILFPLMLIFTYIFLPSTAVTPTVFYYFVMVLIISLILGNYIYSMAKNSDTRYASVVFMLILVLITFNILKDQEAFGNAIQTNLEQVNKVAEEHEKEAKNKTLQSTGIDPQAIFNQKCSACHKFDIKLVGPAYNTTVPKYNGDVQKLAAYIFNPQKIDPAFPPMPNQGLKKKEANAMAQWLIDQVAGKKK
jgi:cytochrome c